jgi:hypothetical protein
MFDDLITKKPKSSSSTSSGCGSTGPSISSRSKPLTTEQTMMLNLLIDAETIIVDMSFEYINAIGNCWVCNAKEGDGHKEKCDIRTTILRLSTEIDRIDVGV